MTQRTTFWRLLIIVLGCIAAIAVVGGVLMYLPSESSVWRYIRNDRPNEGKSVKQLLAELENADPMVRKQAAGDLGKLGEQAQPAIPALAQHVIDESPEVRVQASLALTKLKVTDPAVVAPLSKAVNDDIALVRMNAVLTLSRLGPEAKEAVPALITAVGQERNVPRIYPLPTSVMEMAIEALGKMGPAAKEAVPELSKFMNDPKKSIAHRANAARAVWRIDKDLKKTMPVFVESLKSSNFEARDLTLETLGAVGSEAKEAVPELVKVLEDKQETVQTRGLAAQTLAKIGPEAKSAVPALILALDASDFYLRNSSVHALGAIGPEARAAVPVLEDLAKKKGDMAMNKASKEALKKIDPQAAAKLESE